MSNDLVVANRESWLVIKEQAEEVKKAGLLPANVSSAQAAIIILKGRELGIGPMRALEGLYVVSGKVAMQANLMMSLIRERCPGAVIKTKRKDAKGCILEASRPGQDPETFQFLEEDANRAGLIKPGGPWQKYPASMYWSRAVTLMARQLFPDILGGAYTPEELGGDSVDHDTGEIIEAKPVQQTDRAKAITERVASAANIQSQVTPKQEMVSEGGYVLPTEKEVSDMASFTKQKAQSQVVDLKKQDFTKEAEQDLFDGETKAVPNFAPGADYVIESGLHTGKYLGELYLELGHEKFTEIAMKATEAASKTPLDKLRPSLKNFVVKASEFLDNLPHEEGRV